jgi:hypothetical protein
VRSRSEIGQLRSVKIGALRRIPQAALADFIAALTEEQL